jgi:ribosomal protein S27E
MKVVEVKCKCGMVVGVFGAADDHSSVYTRCPGCGNWHEIYNQMLLQVEETIEGDGFTMKNMGGPKCDS